MNLSDYMGAWKGQSIIVAGCGESLKDFPALPPECITIGVNDVGRKFLPTYCVVVNHFHDFIRSGRAEHCGKALIALFTHIPQKEVNHPNTVMFKLGKQNGTDLDDPETIDYTSNSPYVAVILAAKMGAQRIGLIGVDFSTYHFFGNAGRHPLLKSVAKIDQEYTALKKKLDERGIEAYNLSPISKLTAFPKISLEDFYG